MDDRPTPMLQFAVSSNPTGAVFQANRHCVPNWPCVPTQPALRSNLTGAVAEEETNSQPTIYVLNSSSLHKFLHLQPYSSPYQDSDAPETRYLTPDSSASPSLSLNPTTLPVPAPTAHYTERRVKMATPNVHMNAIASKKSQNPKAIGHNKGAVNVNMQSVAADKVQNVKPRGIESPIMNFNIISSDNFQNIKPTGINGTPQPPHSPHHITHQIMDPNLQPSKKKSRFSINSGNQTYATKAPMNPAKINPMPQSHHAPILAKRPRSKPALNYHQLATLNLLVINHGYRSFKEFAKLVQTRQAQVDSYHHQTSPMMRPSNTDSGHQAYQAYTAQPTSTQRHDPNTHSNHHQDPMMNPNMNAGHQSHQAHVMPMASDQTPNPSIISNHQHLYNGNSGYQKTVTVDPVAPLSIFIKKAKTVTNSAQARPKCLQVDKAGFLLPEIKAPRPKARSKLPRGEKWRKSWEKPSPAPGVEVPNITYTLTAACDVESVPVKKSKDDIAPNGLFDRIFGLHWDLKEWPFVPEIPAKNDLEAPTVQLGGQKRKISQVDQVDENSNAKKFKQGEQDVFDWHDVDAFVKWATENPDICDLTSTEDTSGWIAEFSSSGVITLQPFQPNTEPAAPEKNVAPVALVAPQKRRLSQVDEVEENLNSKKVKQKEDSKEDAFDWDVIDELIEVIAQNKVTFPAADVEEFAAWAAQVSSPPAPAAQTSPPAAQIVLPASRMFHPVVGPNTNLAPQKNHAPKKKPGPEKKIASVASVASIAPQKRRLSQVTHVEPQNSTAKKIKQKEDSKDDIFDWSVIDELIEAIDQSKVTFPKAAVDEFAQWAAHVSPPAPQTVQPVIGSNTTNVAKINAAPVVPHKRRISQVAEVEPQNSTAKKVKQKEDSKIDIFDWSIIDELIEAIDQGKIIFPKAAVKEFARWAAQASNPVAQTNVAQTAQTVPQILRSTVNPASQIVRAQTVNPAAQHLRSAAQMHPTAQNLHLAAQAVCAQTATQTVQNLYSTFQTVHPVAQTVRQVHPAAMTVCQTAQIYTSAQNLYRAAQSVNPAAQSLQSAAQMHPTAQNLHLAAQIVHPAVQALRPASQNVHHSPQMVSQAAQIYASAQTVCPADLTLRPTVQAAAQNVNSAAMAVQNLRLAARDLQATVHPAAQALRSTDSVAQNLHHTAQSVHKTVHPAAQTVRQAAQTVQWSVNPAA
ncbi:hypothetical protein EX30DRAFT_388017 [Ascodesmis nigricans]|uniref:Uncharacterized protein n=1 Tax=Ascodesmis nigricans TaxID=341454 RepID=A0A4S2MK66_9PEZI|nr:hypothetical protein EX30DRAFT_388017 [Ascodesmis nigricans]